MLRGFLLFTTVILLLSRGADKTLLDAESRTAAALARQAGHQEIVELLDK